MAYTGTGTQSDPFVVTTFADFLSCVAQEGVYVEVGADLDAAAEGFGYISPIDVKAVEVYGTAGDTLRKISNVTVEGNAVFDFRYSTTVATDITIQCLHMENWTWKATSNPYVTSHSPTMFYRSNGSAYLRQCKMSVSVTAALSSSTPLRLKDRVFTADSAFVMDLHNVSNFIPCSSYYSYNGSSNTTFSIDGNGTTTWTAGTSSNTIWVNCTNTGIVLKNMEVTGGPGISDGEGFSYLVFEDCTLPGESAIYAVKESNLICFAGTTSDESARVNSGTVVTQSQLKDKAYLQSIGWLP
jgi:hypothetical protein